MCIERERKDTAINNLQVIEILKSFDIIVRDEKESRVDFQNGLQICCFPSNLLGKKAVLSEEMANLTSNSSDAFLQNLSNLRSQRDNTPTNSNNGRNEEIVLLEKQGRSSQKLRSNLAQVSSTIGSNMTDISNISGPTKVLMDNLK